MRVPLRFFRWWMAMGLGFVSLVVYLSLNTDPIPVGRIETVKVGHFVAYGWLMLWFSQLFIQGHRVTAAVLLALMGIALEYAQGFVGYRSFAYSDMRDNVLGVAGGWFLAMTPAGRVLRGVEARYLRGQA